MGFMDALTLVLIVVIVMTFLILLTIFIFALYKFDHVKWWRCKVWKLHDWTSATQEGIRPTKHQLESPHGFQDFAKTYCKRCLHE